MAVRQEYGVRRFIGLSSDTKPVIGTQLDGATTLADKDITPGSTFLESDTGRIFRWTGTEWAYPVDAGSERDNLLQSILDELREIKLQIVAATS